MTRGALAVTGCAIPPSDRGAPTTEGDRDVFAEVVRTTADDASIAMPGDDLPGGFDLRVARSTNEPGALVRRRTTLLGQGVPGGRRRDDRREVDQQTGTTAANHPFRTATMGRRFPLP